MVATHSSPPQIPASGTRALSSCLTSRVSVNDGAPEGPFRSRLRVIKQVLLEGGPGFCQFAINNARNAGCEFCSFNVEKLPRADWVFAPLPESKAALDILGATASGSSSSPGASRCCTRNSSTSSGTPRAGAWS
jgi:hypothetical protein